MSERDLSRVNETAGKLANGVVEMLHADGVKNALVWVTDGFAFDMPLSVRTPDNDGFGRDEYPYYSQIRDLRKAAILQARYAKASAGRSAHQQEGKLDQFERTATSYGVGYAFDTMAGFAIDPKTGLTVSAVAKGVDPLSMAKYSEAAIAMVDRGHMPKMLEAGKWMHACYELLQPRLAALSPESSGIAMIALPYYYSQLASEMHPGPVVVAAQTVGAGLDPAKFDIVAAKAKCVTITGKPSGMVGDELRQFHSNILGAVPARFNEYGGRVLAVGGLDMKDDVELIKEVASGDVGVQLGVTLLREFAR
jgi:hypothetical protein